MGQLVRLTWKWDIAYWTKRIDISIDSIVPVWYPFMLSESHSNLLGIIHNHKAIPKPAFWLLSWNPSHMWEILSCHSSNLGNYVMCFNYFWDAIEIGCSWWATDATFFTKVIKHFTYVIKRGLLSINLKACIHLKYRTIPCTILSLHPFTMHGISVESHFAITCKWVF